MGCIEVSFKIASYVPFSPLANQIYVLSELIFYLYIYNPKCLSFVVSPFENKQIPYDIKTFKCVAWFNILHKQRY